jgi:hypothetical protein
VVVTPNPVMYLNDSDIHQRIDKLLAELTASLCDLPDR